MRFAQLGAGAAVAGLSQAFLIPSTIVATDSKEHFTLPFESKALTRERVVEVDCPGCPVETNSEGLMSWSGAESILRLNISVVQGDTDKLMVNELQVYPVNLSIDRLVPSLTADQLIKSPDNTWVYTSSPQLGYGMRMRHPFSAATESKNGLGLISFHLEIIEVGNQFVRGVPSLEFVVVETQSGQLMIGDAHTEPSRNLASSSVSGKQDCATLLCKWKAIIAAKTAALKKGCGAKNKGHGFPRPHGIKGGPNKYPHHSRPRPGFRQGHRRPHHSMIASMFRSFVFYVVVPVAIGIAVGLTASVIGMIFGHIAIVLWRLLFRRGERAEYYRVKQDEVLGDAEDENNEFLEKQGPPPVYEVIIVDEKAEQN